MLTKVLIGVAALGVVIIGGVAVIALFSNRSQNIVNNTAEDGLMNDESAETTDASINDFLATGENKKCEYSDGEYSGTMYFSNQRLRADYEKEDESGSMIIKSEEQYIWDNNTKTGLIFNLSGNESSASSDMSLDDNYSFTCVNWSVDENLFAVPSDVTLTEFSIPF